LRSLRSYL